MGWDFRTAGSFWFRKFPLGKGPMISQQKKKQMPMRENRIYY